MEIDDMYEIYDTPSKKQKKHGTFQSVSTPWVVTVSYYEPGIACCRINDGGEMIEYHKIVFAISEHEAISQGVPNPWQLNEHYTICARPYKFGSWIIDE